MSALNRSRGKGAVTEEWSFVDKNIVATTNRSVGKAGGDDLSFMHVLLASILVFLSPPFVMIFVYVTVKLGGDLRALQTQVEQVGVYKTLSTACFDHILGSKKAWTMIISFAAFELVLMRILPGRQSKGPVTPHGNVPVYKANGMLCFLVTMCTFLGLSVAGVIHPSDVYDNFQDIIGALNIFSLFFVLVLYLKGRFAPTSSDHSLSGNVVFDYYWGTELYPRILGWDVKLFTNCRFGLMAWATLLICYAWKQWEAAGGLSDSMAASVALQLIYLAKFYHWEMGYMKSLDIMHDRAGFYICWGCLVWVPSIYTSHALYLVNHPNILGPTVAAAIFTIGWLSIFVNYQADYQRELVRRTNGQCKVWGSDPKLIRAKYRTTQGEVKESVLLVSGWWGVARHFHYVPELVAALCWSIPALFASPLPYFYFVMLLVLLVHRSLRDDRRCQEKYKDYWDEYRKHVPYRILPWVF